MDVSKAQADIERAAEELGDPEAYYRVVDFQDALGLGEAAVRQRIRLLLRAKRLERGKVEPFENMRGYRQQTLGYRVPPKKRERR